MTPTPSAVFVAFSTSVTSLTHTVSSRGPSISKVFSSKCFQQLPFSIQPPDVLGLSLQSHSSAPSHNPAPKTPAAVTFPWDLPHHFQGFSLCSGPRRKGGPHGSQRHWSFLLPSSLDSLPSATEPSLPSTPANSMP